MTETTWTEILDGCENPTMDRNSKWRKQRRLKSKMARKAMRVENQDVGNHLIKIVDIT